MTVLEDLEKKMRYKQHEKIKKKNKGKEKLIPKIKPWTIDCSLK